VVVHDAVRQSDEANFRLPLVHETPDDLGRTTAAVTKHVFAASTGGIIPENVDSEVISIEFFDIVLMISKRSLAMLRSEPLRVTAPAHIFPMSVDRAWQMNH